MLCQYSSCTAAEKQFSPLLWPKFPVVAQRANCINSTSFDQKKNQPIIFEANYIIYNSYRLILQVITQSFEFIRLAHATTQKFLSLGGVHCTRSELTPYPRQIWLHWYTKDLSFDWMEARELATFEIFRTNSLKFPLWFPRIPFSCSPNLKSTCSWKVDHQHVTLFWGEAFGRLWELEDVLVLDDELVPKLF